MVESWSKENGAFCWVRPRSQREGQSLGWGTKQALVPCWKVLECSQVWNGCTTGFLLTHPKREKKKSNQVEISSFLWRWSGRWMEKSNC